MNENNYIFSLSESISAFQRWICHIEINRELLRKNCAKNEQKEKRMKKNYTKKICLTSKAKHL